MPFKTFNNWLFDGSRNSPIPEPKTDDKGKVLVPDILKYNSPINHTYLISMFLAVGPLNHYLDQYFNNINLRYLDRADLMHFIKRCVLDFRVNRRQIAFMPYKRKAKIFDELQKRLPLFKIEEINMLIDIIEKSDERDRVYETMGIETPKKKKIKLKKETKKGQKISLNKLLKENFSIVSK